MHHTIMNPAVKHDRQRIQDWLAKRPETESVAQFKPNPHIQKLDLSFDIGKLRQALEEALSSNSFVDQGAGFRAFPLTRRPGDNNLTGNDLSGRYYMRHDESYEEVAMEEIVDEAGFSEFVPDYRGTYFERVYDELSARCRIGRMRVLMKDSYNCNSWHRDPEPRIHIPIISNPGSLFIVNHHCTHLPADGSAYFTDTRGYHTALNGGPSPRVHIVVALPKMD